MMSHAFDVNYKGKHILNYGDMSIIVQCLDLIISKKHLKGRDWFFILYEVKTQLFWFILIIATHYRLNCVIKREMDKHTYIVA